MVAKLILMLVYTFQIISLDVMSTTFFTYNVSAFENSLPIITVEKSILNFSKIRKVVTLFRKIQRYKKYAKFAQFA